jgi:hypothetical protein
MCGWIKIHRSIKDHWLYTEKRTFSKFEAWHDILLMVNFTDAKLMIKGKLYDIKRGQSILSLESWGKRWNWDKSKVRRFMNTLQSDSMIVLESDNITTRLTVCKYETYQGERNANETQVKRKRNANEHQTTPIKEREELKEEEQEKEVFDISVFEEFWNLYEKKLNKEESLSAFKKIKSSEYDLIKSHIPNFVKQFKDKQFQPYFSTYLNKKRWQDEVQIQTQVTPNRPKLATLQDE